MALSWLESSAAFVALRDTASMEQLGTTTNIEDKRWVDETAMTLKIDSICVVLVELKSCGLPLSSDRKMVFGVVVAC